MKNKRFFALLLPLVLGLVLAAAVPALASGEISFGFFVNTTEGPGEDVETRDPYHLISVVYPQDEDLVGKEVTLTLSPVKEDWLKDNNVPGTWSFADGVETFTGVFSDSMSVPVEIWMYVDEVCFCTRTFTSTVAVSGTFVTRNVTVTNPLQPYFLPLVVK